MARLMELNFGSTCEGKKPKDPKLWHLYVCMDEDQGPWFRKQKCIIVHDPSVDLKLLGELFKKVSEELSTAITTLSNLLLKLKRRMN
jgi:hypothetical protein